jgi:hypothetical protein
MAEWKRYQEETAKLFRELGCEVEIDVEVQGARAKHAVDVSVRFSRFGLKQHWIIECKYWKRRVPKEKVLALKSIVEDVGADRGILMAERGHQSGAHQAATLTNITLTSLAQLREAAKAELLTLGFSEVRRRAAIMTHEVMSLYDKAPDDRLPSWTTRRPKPGTDGTTLSRIGSYITRSLSRQTPKKLN